MNKRGFLSKYWYKADLIQLCKKFNLQTFGTKALIQKRILYFLETGSSPHEKNTKRIINKNHEISLHSKFIADGLAFNADFRLFIASYLGIKKVAFTKHMAHAVREAQRKGSDITVKELISILQNPKHFFHETEEDKTYQWNNFVKDFHKSKLTQAYKNKLHIAALLWSQVKDSSEGKIYTDDLLKKYNSLIKNTTAHNTE